MTFKTICLANARLPTEKAHGYQIVKMCQAFAQNKARVLLLHPSRRQPNPRLKDRSVFDYYGVPPAFQEKELIYPDVVVLERFLPQALFKLLILVRNLSWGFYAAFVADREGADLYFTRDLAAAYWLTRFNLPTIFEAHVIPKRSQRWLLKRIIGRSALDRVVALASSVRRELIELGFSPEEVVVLPHGVDLALYENLPSKEEARRRLDISLGREIVGYIGRFRAGGMEKGIPELVQSMKFLSRSSEKEPLLLCVGGPIEAVPEYLRLAESCGVSRHRLRFVDRVPNYEVPLWIRACDVVALPLSAGYVERVGAMPLKLFEYMAAQTPIVATDQPPVREILCDGKNAILVSSTEPRVLAEGVQRVLEMPDGGKKLAMQAFRDVRRRTWEKRAANVLHWAQSRPVS